MGCLAFAAVSGIQITGRALDRDVIPAHQDRQTTEQIYCGDHGAAQSVTFTKAGK